MTRVISCSILLLSLLYGISFAAEPLKTKIVNDDVALNNLKSIEKLYLVISSEPSANINIDKIEDAVEGRLKKAGIIMAQETSLDPNSPRGKAMAKRLREKGISATNLRTRSGNIPELIITIKTARAPSGIFAYHIQTSLSKKVYLKASVRTATKAFVWRIDRPIGFADANELQNKIQYELNGQVDAFIAAWRNVNSNKIKTEKAKTTTHSNTIATGYYQNTQDKAEPARDGYVASKNSKVFHKMNCSHARRISQKNKVTFKTKNEAVQSGRHPCKTCKP